MRIGVLALQGDVREHRAALEAVGAAVTDVRRPEDLDGLAGIVLPGGESTTLSMLLESSGLFEPLSAAVRAGLPTFGTCAGMILLADEVEDGRPDQRSFGALQVAVRRNGYGRQRYSFERDLDAKGLEAALQDTCGAPDAREAPEPADPEVATMPAVFIRAPVVVATGPEVEVLARLTDDATGDGDPVAVRQGNVLATTFHPELTGDRRLHRLFVAMAGTGAPSGR